MKNRSVFFYMIIGLALLIAAGLVWLLAPGNAPDTPAVVLPTAVPADSVDPGEAETNGSVLNVTPANVQAALATLHRADCYSRSLQIRDFYSGGSRSRKIDVYSRADALRIDIYADGSAAEHVLLQDGQKWLWYADSDRVYIGEAAAADADAYQTVLTYEDVLDAPAEDILDAGYADFNGVYCIFVRWRFGSLGYESECYIDPASGLLLGERSYDGDVLVYSMDSTLPELTAPEDSRFTAP